MPTIRVEDEVFEGLKRLAEPFVDTPGSVIRKLLEEKGVLPERRRAERREVAGARARATPLTPQALYEQYLLETLARDFDGRGAKREVTQAVIEHMRKDGHLGPADLEFVATGETKAENTIGWARNALKERGLIARGSPRGVWELTPEGRGAAE